MGFLEVHVCNAIVEQWEQHILLLLGFVESLVIIAQCCMWLDNSSY